MNLSILEEKYVISQFVLAKRGDEGKQEANNNNCDNLKEKEMELYSLESKASIKEDKLLPTSHTNINSIENMYSDLADSAWLLSY